MAKKAALKASTKLPSVPSKKDEGGESFDTALVAMPNKAALSLDAGMKALNAIASLVEGEVAISEIRESTETRRGEAQVTLAEALWKAGLNDKSIRLADSLLDVKTHKTEKNKLGKQVRLALGLMVSDGKKVTLTKEADEKLNAQPGDDAATLKRKKSIRSNFSTMLTKAMRVALYAIENNLQVSVDTSQGYHLRLTDSKKSAGAVQKHFGMASILLNEDQNQKILDKKGQTVDTKEAKVRPSFTEITRAVGESHGKVIEARKDSRATKAVSVEDHIISVAQDLRKAIEKYQGAIPEMVAKELSALQNAISKAIE